MHIRARAPGRVNLIGGHTDYTGGLVLPMAIDRGTVIEGERGGDEVVLSSREEPGLAVLPLDLADPTVVEPAWARYAAGVVSVLGPTAGFTGAATTTIPIGAGLSSSAAFEVAIALALGFEGDALELALACQQAEHVATGVPCGVMDQLASAAGVDGHALLIDCSTLTVDPIALPESIEVLVVHSGQRRTLSATPYAERREQCRAAEALVGPLRSASLDDVGGIPDPLLRRRARHVVGENGRVRAMAEALRNDDRRAAGEAMAASHASLRDDFEVSTPALDDLVARLSATAGVVGARLTGAGFGGCAVALVERGTPVEGWRVAASAGATVELQP